MMVARDPLNKTASFVNPLKLVTSDEKEVFHRGIENKKRYNFIICFTITTNIFDRIEQKKTMGKMMRKSYHGKVMSQFSSQTHNMAIYGVKES